VTQCQRILALLSDGRPHSHHELYALGCVAHSRVSELRKRGYRIDQWKDGNLYLYRLLGESAATEPDAFPVTARPTGGTVGASTADSPSEPVQPSLFEAAA
jgi:hypothetical protein